MAVSFTITVPDVWAQRMLEPINERAFGIEGHNVIQKILIAWGKDDVESLSAKERAELTCLFFLWNLTALYESELASNTARQAALQSAIDDFNG